MKKQLLLCLLLTGCLLSSLCTIVQAETVFESNGVTSFFGKYEQPKEESKGESEKELETASNQKDAANAATASNKVLPATGSNEVFKLQLTGVFCLLMGAVIIYRRLKNEKKYSYNNRTTL